jgi:hypothetical protein
MHIINILHHAQTLDRAATKIGNKLLLSLEVNVFSYVTYKWC